MLGAYLGGMLERCLSDAIYRFRFKYKEKPSSLRLQSHVRVCLAPREEGVFL